MSNNDLSWTFEGEFLETVIKDTPVMPCTDTLTVSYALPEPTDSTDPHLKLEFGPYIGEEIILTEQGAHQLHQLVKTSLENSIDMRASISARLLGDPTTEAVDCIITPSNNQREFVIWILHDALPDITLSFSPSKLRMFKHTLAPPHPTTI